MVGFVFGLVLFGMSFEVCECGGLWVSCGSGIVVVAAIWWLWWLFFGLLWNFYLFFIFYKVVLVDVGLCRWWLSVLLWQWLLVAIVAAVVVLSLLLLMMMRKS